MAKHLRYMGEFLSRAGVVWRVEILQDADVPFSIVGSLDFEADEALVIEWGHSEKEEVICGSTATLRLESPGDRTYEDLYTIAPGRIRMDVYREGSLYWSGTLDPEFYEEPYERAANYPVSLTFSDFGVFDRLKYDMSGMRSLRDIVDCCIKRASINTVIDESLISTGLTAGGDAMSLADLKVRSDNFYDEDSEALTLKEVLEGILQPLALRMVQRAGRVYVYDLNALYHTDPTPVVWDGDSQIMGTDKVYNNVKITWGTYAQGGNLTSDECYTEEVDESANAITMLDGREVGDARLYTYPTVLKDPIDPYDLGFSIWLTDKGKNAEIADSRAKFYRIVPHFDGQESEGVALCWPGIGYAPGHNDAFTYSVNGVPKGDLSLKSYPPTAGKVLFRTKEAGIPKIPQADKHGIRVTLEMLMDCRFNPFENDFVNYEPNDKEGQNHEWYQSWWATYGNIIYVPVTIQYRDALTGDLYVWTNRRYVADGSPTRVPYLNNTYGEWVRNTGTEDSPSEIGYLAYYQSERAGVAAAGTVGWSRNRPAIPPINGPLGISVAKAQDGQYIPYPNFGKDGGQIWMDVRTDGWLIANISPMDYFNKDAFANAVNDPNNFFRYNKFNWLLLRLPEIEILNTGYLNLPIDTDDVEYSAEINAEAKDGIELDTICGSSAEGVPLARGAYFASDSGDQITRLTRAGRTSQVEDLLIGTLFSQFGQRRTRLSGEMEIARNALGVFSEANQGDKKFMLTADVQDVITDVSDAEITELRPDEYQKRN